MREFAKTFYKSKAWKECRDAYAASVAHLCEQCGEPGEIVHHICHITPDNISDPRITLNWDNLELVCRKCHGMEHATHKPRYYFNEYGEVIAPPSTKIEGTP